MDKLLERELAKWKKELGEVSAETDIATINIQGVTHSVGQIIERVITDVANKSLSAGMGGQMGDGGARALMKSLEAWIAGIERGTPPEFQKVMLAMHKENNPEEYEDYLRLKKVYGD